MLRRHDGVLLCRALSLLTVLQREPVWVECCCDGDEVELSKRKRVQLMVGPGLVVWRLSSYEEAEATPKNSRCRARLPKQRAACG